MIVSVSFSTHIRTYVVIRTRIHLNLFFAILLQSIIRLIFFIDELAYKLNLKDGSNEAAYESQMMKYHVCLSFYYHYFLI